MSFKWFRMLLQPLNNNLQQLCLRRTAAQSKAISKGVRHARLFTTMHNQRKMEILRKNADLLNQISVITKLPSCLKLVGNRSEPMLKKWSYLTARPSSRCFLKAHGMEARRNQPYKLSRKISSLEKFHQASQESRCLSRSLPNMDCCCCRSTRTNNRHGLLTRPAIRKVQTCDFSNWQAPIYPVSFTTKTETPNPNLQLIKKTIQQTKNEYSNKTRELPENRKARKRTYKGYSTAEPISPEYVNSIQKAKNASMAKNHIWLKKSNKNLDLLASNSHHSLTKPPASTRTLQTYSNPSNNVKLMGKLALDMKKIIFSPPSIKKGEKLPMFRNKAFSPVGSKAAQFFKEPVLEEKKPSTEAHRVPCKKSIDIPLNLPCCIPDHDDKTLVKVPSFDQVDPGYFFKNPIKLPPELREKAFVENYLNNLTTAQSYYHPESVLSSLLRKPSSTNGEENEAIQTKPIQNKINLTSLINKPLIHKKWKLSQELVHGPKLIWKDGLTGEKIQNKLEERVKRKELKHAKPQINLSNEAHQATQDEYREAMYKSFCEMAKHRNLFTYVPPAKPKLRITFPTYTIDHSLLERKLSNWNMAVQSANDPKYEPKKLPPLKKKIAIDTECVSGSGYSDNCDSIAATLPQSASNVPIGFLGMCKHNPDGKTEKKDHCGAHSLFTHRIKHRKSKEIRVSHNRKRQSRNCLENMFRSKLKQRGLKSYKMKQDDWVDSEVNLLDTVRSNWKDSKLVEYNANTCCKPKDLVSKAGDINLPAILRERNIDILKQKITTPITACKQCGLFHSLASQGKCPLLELMKSSEKNGLNPMFNTMFKRTYSTNITKDMCPTATDELLNVCRYCGLIHSNSKDNCPMNQALKLFATAKKSTSDSIHPSESPTRLPKKEVMLKRIRTLQDNLKLCKTIKKSSVKRKKSGQFELQNEAARKVIVRHKSPQIKDRSTCVNGVVKAYNKKKIPDAMKCLEQCRDMNREELSKFTKSLESLLKTLMQVTNPSMADSAKIVHGKMHFIIEDDSGSIVDPPKEIKQDVNPHCRKCSARKAGKTTMSKSQVTYSNTQKTNASRSRYNFEITCKKITSTRNTSTGNRSFNTSCVPCLSPRREVGSPSINSAGKNTKNFSVSSFRLDQRRNKQQYDSTTSLSKTNSDHECGSNERLRQFVSIADSKRMEVATNPAMNIVSLKLNVPETEIRERRCKTCIDTLKQQIEMVEGNRRKTEVNSGREVLLGAVNQTKSDIVINQIEGRDDLEELSAVRKTKELESEERKRARSLINLKPSGIEKHPKFSSMPKTLKIHPVEEPCEEETRQVHSSSRISANSESAHRTFQKNSNFCKRQELIRQRARLSSAHTAKEFCPTEPPPPEDCPPPPCPICPSKVDHTCERKLCNPKANLKNTITKMMKIKNWCEMDLLQARMKKQRERKKASSKRAEEFYKYYRCDAHRTPVEEATCYIPVNEVCCEEYLCPPDDPEVKKCSKTSENKTLDPDVCILPAVEDDGDSCALHNKEFDYGPLTESEKKCETARCRSLVAKGMVFEIDKSGETKDLEREERSSGSENSQSPNYVDDCTEDLEAMLSQTPNDKSKSTKSHLLAKPLMNYDLEEKQFKLDAESSKLKCTDYKEIRSKKISPVSYSSYDDEGDEITLDSRSHQADDCHVKCQEVQADSIASSGKSESSQCPKITENCDKASDIYRNACAKEILCFKSELNSEVKKEPKDSIGLRLGRAELEERSQKLKANDLFRICSRPAKDVEEMSTHTRKSSPKNIKRKLYSSENSEASLDSSFRCKDYFNEDATSISTKYQDADDRMMKTRKNSVRKKTDYYDEEDSVCSTDSTRKEKSLKSSKAKEKIFVADQGSGCRHIDIENIKLPTFDNTFKDDESSSKKVEFDDEYSISKGSSNLEEIDQRPAKIFEADQCSGARMLEPIFCPDHTSSSRRDILCVSKEENIIDAENDEECTDALETAYSSFGGLRKNENPMRRRERDLEIIKLMEYSSKKMKEQELAKQHVDLDMVSDKVDDGYKLKEASSATCFTTKMEEEEEEEARLGESKDITEDNEIVVEEHEAYNMMSARPKADKYQFSKPNTEIIVELVTEDHRPESWKEAEEQLKTKSQKVEMTATSKQPRIEKDNEGDLKYTTKNEDAETDILPTPKAKREVIKEDWETELTKTLLEKDMPSEQKHAPSATSTFRKNRKPKPTKRTQKSVLEDGHTDDVESGKTSYTDTKLMKYDIENSIFDGQNFYAAKQNATDAEPKVDYAQEIAEKIKYANDYEEDDFKEEMLREEKERRKLREVAQLPDPYTSKLSMHLCYAGNDEKVNDQNDSDSNVAQIRYYPIPTKAQPPRQKYAFDRYNNVDRQIKKLDALQKEVVMDDSKRTYYQEEISKCKKKIQELRASHDSAAAIQNEQKIAANILEHKTSLELKTCPEVQALKLSDRTAHGKKAIMSCSPRSSKDPAGEADGLSLKSYDLITPATKTGVVQVSKPSEVNTLKSMKLDASRLPQKHWSKKISSHMFDPKSSEIEYAALSPNQMDVICTNVLQEIESLKSGKSRIAPVTKEKNIQAKRMEFAKKIDTKALVKAQPQASTLVKDNHMRPKWKYLDQSSHNYHYAQYPNEDTSDGKSGQINKCLQGVKKCLNDYKKCLGDFNLIPKMDSHFEFEPEKTVSTPNLRGRGRRSKASRASTGTSAAESKSIEMMAGSPKGEKCSTQMSAIPLLMPGQSTMNNNKKRRSSSSVFNLNSRQHHMDSTSADKKLGLDIMQEDVKNTNSQKIFDEVTLFFPSGQDYVDVELLLHSEKNDQRAENVPMKHRYCYTEVVKELSLSDNLSSAKSPSCASKEEMPCASTPIEYFQHIYDVTTSKIRSLTQKFDGYYHALLTQPDDFWPVGHYPQLDCHSSALYRNNEQHPNDNLVDKNLGLLTAKLMQRRMEQRSQFGNDSARTNRQTILNDIFKDGSKGAMQSKAKCCDGLKESLREQRMK